MTRGSTTQAVTVGDVTIRLTETTEPIEGQTASGRAATGVATIYEIEGPDRLRLRCADIAWDADDAPPERDVHTLERYGSPQRFDRLCHGLRLTVQAHGKVGCFVELRQARMKSATWSNLFRADRADLDVGARVDVAATLRSVGATEVGYRRHVLGDDGRRRNYVCATFGPEADLVPIVAYVLTRVLPVLHEVDA